MSFWGKRKYAKALILGIAAMGLFSLSAQASESAAEVMDDPSMFIKEGSLPEAASEEIIELIEAPALSEDRQTRAVSESFEDYLVRKLKQKEEEINISEYRFTKDTIYDAYSAVINRHPELYYVGTSLRYSYNMITQRVTSLYVTYYEYDEQAVEEEVQKALALIEDDMTDLEKALTIHDYLCIEVEYAYEDYINGTVGNDAHNLKGALVDKVAVCDGYSSAFQYLMNLMDIPCNMITGTANGGGHAWNQICLDGNWYLLDLTWDDPTWDNYGNVLHSKFLKDADSFEGYEWNTSSYEECTDTAYNEAFWNNTMAQIIRHDGEWYFVNMTGTLKKHDFTEDAITEEGDTVTSIGGKWYVFGSTSTYYQGCFSKIAQKEGKLYYSQPGGIYTCNFDGSQKKQILEVDTTEGYIYGMKIQDDILYYQIATRTFEEPQTLSLIIEETEESETKEPETEESETKEPETETEESETESEKLETKEPETETEKLETKEPETETKESETKESETEELETKEPETETEESETKESETDGSGTKTPESDDKENQDKDNSKNDTLSGMDKAEQESSGEATQGSADETGIAAPAKVKKVAAKSLKKKKAQISWKEQDCDGYRIQFSLKSNFRKIAKTVTIRKSAKVKKTVSGLISGKKYYVRVQAYKIVNGEKVYGAFSKKRKVRVK